MAQSPVCSGGSGLPVSPGIPPMALHWELRARSWCSTRSSGSANWLLMWAPGIPQHRGQQHCYTTPACTVTAAGTWLHSCAAQLAGTKSFQLEQRSSSSSVIQQTKFEGPAQGSQLVMFSSAHTEAHKQCTIIPLHTAELLGSRGSLAGFLCWLVDYTFCISSAHNFLIQPKPVSRSQAPKPSISYPTLTFLWLFCSICTNSSLLKGTGCFLLRRRIKLKQQQDSNAQGTWADRALLAAELSKKRSVF